MRKIIAIIALMLLCITNVYAEGFGKEECTYTVLRRHNFFVSDTADWIRSNNHIAGQIKGCSTKFGKLTNVDNDFFIKKNSANKDAYISTRIYVEKSGTYYIWVNTDNKPDGGNRSGYLWFDNEVLQSDAYNFNNAQTAQAMLEDSGWYWDRDNGTELEAGWHTLYMAADNANFRVDLVVITDDDDKDLLNVSVSEQYGDILEPLTDIESPVIESFDGVSKDFNSISLNFSASDNNVAAGYDIYVNDTLTATVSNENEYTVQGFLPLQEADVKIIAYDLNGNKALSEVKTFTVSPVEIKELVITNEEEVVIEEKSQINAGMELTLSIKLKNNSDTEQAVMPAIALYSASTGRMTASDRENAVILGEGEPIELTVTVPDDFTAEDSLLISVWDTADKIMPLVSGIVW